MPLEERTLTVLGYMIGCWRRSGRDQEPHCNQYHDKSGRNQGKNTAIYGIHPNKVVTTLLGLRGGPARAKPGKIGVFPREGRRPGWFHPKHGLETCTLMGEQFPEYDEWLAAEKFEKAEHAKRGKDLEGD